MKIRWSSIPKDFWETTLSRILVERCLGLAGEFVSTISISLSRSSCHLRGTTELIYCSVVFIIGPGINVAQTSIWIACAMSLAVFDVEKYVDGSGNVVEPEIRYTNGVIR